MTAAPQQVRVTIEGTLQLATNRRDRLSFSGGTWLLPRDLEDVAVEVLERPRTWTDGDVIVSGFGTVWVRDEGKWLSAEQRPTVGFDSDMEQMLDQGDGAEVLRYQVAA